MQPLPDQGRAHMPAIDPGRLAAWRAFLEAHASVIEVLEEELRTEEQLDLTWYDVLVQLSEADGNRLRMQELADAVLLSKSGLTRLVDRMEDAGYVARTPCEEDRRGRWAQLTETGLAALQRTAPTHVRGVNDHFASLLTDEEAAALRSACEKVVAACEDRDDA